MSLANEGEKKEESESLLEKSVVSTEKDVETEPTRKEHHFWSEGRVILTSMYVLFVSDLLSALANAILLFILGDDVSNPGCYAHHKNTGKRIGLRIAYIVSIALTLVGSKFIFSACLGRYRKKHGSSTPDTEKNESHQTLLILVSMYILFVTNFVSEIAKTTLDFFVPPSKCGVRSTFGRLAYFIIFFIILTGIFVLVRYLIKRKDHKKERQEQSKKKTKEVAPINDGDAGRKRKTGKDKNRAQKKKRKGKREKVLKFPR